MSKLENDQITANGRIYMLAKEFHNTSTLQGNTLSRLFDETRVMQAVALEVGVLTYFYAYLRI